MSEEYEPGLVSVIIPTYNRAHLVKEAIDSVLSQTYQNFEIIVVDDGSTDDTKDVLVPYKDKITYIYQQNQGGSAARNTGLKHSKGEYISFVDSDDLWLPEKLEKQVEVLENDNDIGFVFSSFIQIDDSGNYVKKGFRPRGLPFRGNLFWEILSRKITCLIITWLVRRECFEEVGFFNTEFRTSLDREMQLRLCKAYKTYGIREPLAVFRQHTELPRLTRGAAASREHYRFKLLDTVFDDADSTLISERRKSKVISDYYVLAGKGYLSEEDLAAARNRFWLSICSNPLQLKAYIYFVATLTGNKGFGALNEIRRLLIGVSNSFRRLRHKQKCQ